MIVQRCPYLAILRNLELPVPQCRSPVTSGMPQCVACRYYPNSKVNGEPRIPEVQQKFLFHAKYRTFGFKRLSQENAYYSKGRFTLVFRYCYCGNGDARYRPKKWATEPFSVMYENTLQAAQRHRSSVKRP